MRFDVLGPLRVRSRSEIPLRRAALRRLLSVLLLEPARTLTTDELIDRHWPGEVPRTARAALHTHLSQLRAVLGDDVIVTADAGYRLDLRGHQHDRELFDALASSARTAVGRSAWSEVVEDANRALALWRGPPYPELQGDHFAAPTIARLEEERMELIELRAEALLAVGRTEAALPELEHAVTEEPLRERLWEHLMTARARLGRVTEALAAYRDFRGMLDEIGLEPSPRLRDLEERILREDPALVPSRTRHNLPPAVSRFIGRERTLAEIAELLDRHRLVTITGVGGAGKTRLAVEIGQQRADQHPDGIWLVDLTSIADPSLVLSSVAATLGLPSDAAAETSIRSVLRSRRALVILDNCEHLVAVAGGTATLLLTAGPGVSVLATSREALRVPGEALYPLPPLDVPSDEPVDAASVLATESGRLYVDRARLVVPGYELSNEAARDVAEICRRLEGLPLAIELVAAQAGALAPSIVARRLAGGIESVADPRHHRPARQRAMHTTLAWSEALLTEAERAVLARLAVFHGGFTTDAVEAVCAGAPVTPGSALDALSRLVDSSLVQPVREGGVPVRYRLLEPIRAFARTRLEARGELAEIARRHRDHYHELVAGLAGETVETIVARLGNELGNLEAALEWSIAAGEAPPAADLAAELAEFVLAQGQARRGQSHLLRTLSELSFEALPTQEARLRAVLADAHHELGDDDAALEAANRAVDLVRNALPSLAGVRALIASARYRLFVVHADPMPAVALAQEALKVARELDDPRAELRAVLILGHALAWTGNPADGLRRKREGLRLADALEDPPLVLAVYGSFFDALALHGADRRGGPRRLLAEMQDRLGESPWWEEHAPWPWMAYVFMQTGEWAGAEQALEHSRAGHLEGYSEMWTHHATGALRWMQGRSAEADAAVRALRTMTPAARWYHDFFPLEAEVAAAGGDLSRVRRVADEYLAVPVHSTEAAMKTAVLRPLVQAEVDAALATSGDAHRGEHLSRARAARDRAREILAADPPLWSGCLQFEVPATHVLLADAELSRITGPNPELWREAGDAADYAYWRLYAGYRRAEALLRLDQRDEAIAVADELRSEASEIGARGIVDALDRALGHR